MKRKTVLSRIAANTKNKKVITEKWDKTGLLEGLSEDKKSDCAQSLEEITQILINNSRGLDKSAESFNAKLKGGDSPTSYVAGTILPIVRVLYGEKIKQIPTMQHLFDDYVKFLRGDLEAFLVMAYVKEVVSKINANK